MRCDPRPGGWLKVRKLTEENCKALYINFIVVEETQSSTYCPWLGEKRKGEGGGDPAQPPAGGIYSGGRRKTQAFG